MQHAATNCNTLQHTAMYFKSQAVLTHSTRNRKFMNPLMKNRHAARGERGGGGADSVESGAEGMLQVMTDYMPIYDNKYTHDTPIFGFMYSRNMPIYDSMYTPIWC